MERKYNKKNNSLMISSSSEVEDINDNSTESGPDSPPPSASGLNDIKMASTSSTTSSPKRSGKRGAHKRVVSIPIKDVEYGSKLKGETAPPPADSWAWRKYGQKPIKGSPYPRGYYRCSSSKGCPARKQVERSRVDPTTLVVTYSCDHNHPWPPPSRANHHHAPNKSSATAVPTPDTPPTNPDTPDPEPEPEEAPTTRFTSFEDEPMLSTTDHEFPWFGEMETTSSAGAAAIFHSPTTFTGGSRRGGLLADDVGGDLFLPMREEDESLFADLGELPECTAVFRHHRGLGREVQIC